MELLKSFRIGYYLFFLLLRIKISDMRMPLFLLCLVLAASLMPISSLPSASWHTVSEFPAPASCSTAFPEVPAESGFLSAHPEALLV